MFQALFSLKFVQWNENWEISFLDSPLDSNWDFWMLVLGSTLNFFQIHEKIENRDFWMLL